MRTDATGRPGHPDTEPDHHSADHADHADGGAADGAPTPEALLVAVARGDEGAFACFYDRVVSAVMGVVRAVLHDRAQAEEVTQEVFVELWRTAARYRPDRDGAVTWALTMAHRRAVDRVRSAGARVARERAAVAGLGRDRPADEVVETVLATMEQHQVRQHLRVLTAVERESIVLAYYQGRTYREVAQTLRVPPNTVKSRIRAGLRRLRDCLTHDDPHDVQGPAAAWPHRPC